jgi:pseudouridine-5'-phosphate glycosidase
MTSDVYLSDSVQQARQHGGPVVALESTIITHGMPYPENLATALAVEKAVQDAGAIPATIAVINGQIKIGLTHDELDALAQTNNAMKLSRADLAFAVAQGVTGSTTVAATMIAAHKANIKVFATGGIGGVHQGAELTFDISADLQELARTPVTVVSAGAKAILDIPKTLEVLETLGVPVVAFGQDNLPAFWSCDSGLKAPLRVNTAEEIVRFMRKRESLSIDGGMLIGNPVPQDQEIPKAQMDKIIEQSIQDCNAAGISGKAVTPWLLGHIVKLSDGTSLKTNQALIQNNAKLAAQIAVELTRQQTL